MSSDRIANPFPPAAALHTSEAAFRAIFDHADVGIARVARDGRFADANPALCRILGYSRAALLQMTFAEITHPDDLTQSVALFQDAVACTQPHYAIEKRYLKPDGNSVWCHVSGAVVYNDDGTAEQCISVIHDITQRKQAEAALRESNATIDRVLETSPLAIVNLDADDRVLRWNAAAEQMFGWRRDEVIGRLLPIAPPEECRAFERRFDPTLRGVGGVGAEVVRYRKNGSPLDVTIWTAPQRDAAGNIASSLGVIADVSARKRTEAALRASEENYRGLIDLAPNAVLVTDIDGVYLLANEAALSLLGAAQRDDVVGRSTFDVMPPELHPIIRSHLQQISGGVAALPVAEYSFRRLDGVAIDVESRVSRCVYDGQPAVLVLLSDLTERRRVERELVRSQQKYQALVDSVDGIVWEADAATFSFLFVSPQAERILGYPLTKWFEPGFWLTALHPDDRAWAVDFCLRATREKRSHDFEYRMFAADGRIVWMHDHTVVIVENERALLLRGVMIDITARKRLEEQLLQAQKLDAIGRLAGGVAHDFNNILTAMLGYVDMASMQVAEQPQVERHLAAVRSLAERAAELTNQLLAFARRQVLYTRPVNLNALVGSVRGLLERLLPATIHLRTDDQPALWSALAEPSQLEQVIVNLAVNARDAMPDGGELSIELCNLRIPAEDVPAGTGLAPGEYVRLSVRDTGAGIDPKIRKHIFEPFFTTKAAGQGTGLGLATAHGFISQLGGAIEVDSTPGAGTTFHVFLPRATAAASEPIAEPAAAKARHGETVLLVEDEPFVREVAVAALKSSGYQVLSAGGGAEALRIAESHNGNIDLLLTDVVMPHLDGALLSERIRALRPTIRVLFTSGYTEDAVPRAARADGRTTAFLPKPYTPSVLSQRVRELLAHPT